VILCDTGPLVAAFNEADSDHARCAEFLAGNWSRLVVPSLAVTEACHLPSDPQRRGRVGLAAESCAAIADDELRVIEVTPHDYRRMAELLATYSSLRLQVVDACVITLAERLDLILCAHARIRSRRAALSCGLIPYGRRLDPPAPGTSMLVPQARMPGAGLHARQLAKCGFRIT
jgi:predicted nucleic acid-binding protein